MIMPDFAPVLRLAHQVEMETGGLLMELRTVELPLVWC